MKMKLVAEPFHLPGKMVIATPLIVGAVIFNLPTVPAEIERFSVTQEQSTMSDVFSGLDSQVLGYGDLSTFERDLVRANEQFSLATYEAAKRAANTTWANDNFDLDEFEEIDY